MEELFEFDPEKSRRNEERHGVSLEWARRLWGHSHAIFPAKDAQGEGRWFILARVDGLVYMAVFTMRGRRIRLISCHRADRKQERNYEIWVEAKEA